MAITLYDLVGRDDRRFSPFCWRARMAIAHKGLEVQTQPTRFTEIAGICGGGQTTLPVIDDGGRFVSDSWAIAEYLEEQYPDRPSLFGGEAGRSFCLFLHHWVGTAVHPSLLRLVVRDVHDHLTPEDQAYFRASRERRLGASLEAAQAGREQRVDAFRVTLDPVRTVLSQQDFFAGRRPSYADYVLFGTLRWPRTISPFQILAAEDIVSAWYRRCLELHGGIAQTAPLYD